MLYIQRILPAFAKEHAYIEMCVTRTEGEPEIQALYHNGAIKAIETKNKDMEGIMRGVEELAYQKGNLDRQYKYPVISNNPSVEKIWDPFHDQIFRP